MVKGNTPIKTLLNIVFPILFAFSDTIFVIDNKIHDCSSTGLNSDRKGTVYISENDFYANGKYNRFNCHIDQSKFSGIDYSRNDFSTNTCLPFDKFVPFVPSYKHNLYYIGIVANDTSINLPTSFTAVTYSGCFSILQTKKEVIHCGPNCGNSGSYVYDGEVNALIFSYKCKSDDDVLSGNLFPGLFIETKNCEQYKTRIYKKETVDSLSKYVIENYLVREGVIYPNTMRGITRNVYRYSYKTDSIWHFSVSTLDFTGDWIGKSAFLILRLWNMLIRSSAILLVLVKIWKVMNMLSCLESGKEWGLRKSSRSFCFV